MSAKLPEHRGRSRLLGVGHNGELVDNVTAENRFDVDESNPWLAINLFSEDMTRLLKSVYIPNTRERPDAVLWLGNVFEVVNTNLPIPIYRQVMSATAVDKPLPRKDSLL